MKYRNLICCFFLIWTLQSYSSSSSRKDSVTIYVSESVSKDEMLAAREIRKYIYQRTSELLPVIKIRNSERINGNSIIVGVYGNPLMKSIKFSSMITSSGYSWIT